MRAKSKYVPALAMPFLVFIIMSMGFDNVYAHKAQIVGDYKIEIGWEEEPPIQGINNSIELVVTYATESEKQKASSEADNEDMIHDDDHDEMNLENIDDSDKERDDADKHDAVKEGNNHEGGASGLEDTVQVTVALDEQTSIVVLKKTTINGIYHGTFTPSSSGHPVAHLSGMIHETEINLDMHPEEVEPLNTLPPLKQIDYGIEPNDVQCKTGLELYMRVHENSAICANSDLGERLMTLGVVDYF